MLDIKSYFKKKIKNFVIANNLKLTGKLKHNKKKNYNKKNYKTSKWECGENELFSEPDVQIQVLHLANPFLQVIGRPC